MTGIFYDTKEFEMSYDRDYMIAELQKRVCRVIFKKVNGEERDMQCTLIENALPPLQSKPSDEKRQPNQDVIRAFDTMKGEFRSFRVENVISFT